jgi:hypothetical protein
MLHSFAFGDYFIKVAVCLGQWLWRLEGVFKGMSMIYMEFFVALEIQPTYSVSLQNLTSTWPNTVLNRRYITTGKIGIREDSVSYCILQCMRNWYNTLKQSGNYIYHLL